MKAPWEKFLAVLLGKASEPLGIALIFLILWGTAYIALFQVDLLKPFAYQLIPVSFVSGLIGAAVIYGNAKPPRVPRGHQGICLAIRTENAEEAARIELDLTAPIRRVLQSTPSPVPFYVLSVSAKLAEEIDGPDAALRLLNRTNSRLLLHGSLKKRRSAGKDMYSLRFDGLVTHAPTSEVNSRLLGSDMSLILPTNLRIACDHDLDGFEVTSHQVAHASKYIVAIAYLLSGADGEASELLNSLHESRREIERAAKLPNTKKLLALVPKRRYELCLNKASEIYSQWRSSHDTKLIERLEESLGSIPDEFKAAAPVRNLRAICAFILHRDVAKATSELQECRKLDGGNPIYNYSLAFLAAYRGDLDESHRRYKQAFEADLTQHLSVEVEEFIDWCAQGEPDKVQLFFAMGYINGRKKKDAEIAIADFRRFVGSADQAKYGKQIQLADRFIRILEAGRWITT